MQINAGVIKPIDGRKVAAALGKSGRPQVMEKGKRVNVYLDDESITTAQKIGGGNVSEGIRIALKQTEQKVRQN